MSDSSGRLDNVSDSDRIGIDLATPYQEASSGDHHDPVMSSWAFSVAHNVANAHYYGAESFVDAFKARHNYFESADEDVAIGSDDSDLSLDVVPKTPKEKLGVTYSQLQVSLVSIGLHFDVGVGELLVMSDSERALKLERLSMEMFELHHVTNLTWRDILDLALKEGDWDSLLFAFVKVQPKAHALRKTMKAYIKAIDTEATDYRTFLTLFRNEIKAPETHLITRYDLLRNAAALGRFSCTSKAGRKSAKKATKMLAKQPPLMRWIDDQITSLYPDSGVSQSLPLYTYFHEYCESLPVPLLPHEVGSELAVAHAGDMLDVAPAAVEDALAPAYSTISYGNGPIAQVGMAEVSEDAAAIVEETEPDASPAVFYATSSHATEVILREEEAPDLLPSAFYPTLSSMAEAETVEASDFGASFNAFYAAHSAISLVQRIDTESILEHFDSPEIDLLRGDDFIPEGDLFVADDAVTEDGIFVATETVVPDDLASDALAFNSAEASRDSIDTMLSTIELDSPVVTPDRAPLAARAFNHFNRSPLMQSRICFFDRAAQGKENSLPETPHFHDEGYESPLGKGLENLHHHDDRQQDVISTIEDIASYQSSETHDAAAGLQFVPATTFFEHNSGAGALPTQGPNDARSSLSKVEGWLSPGSRRSSLLERTVMFGGDLDALNTSEDRDNGWKALRVSRH